MAKKTSSTTSSSPVRASAPTTTSAAPVSSTPVRNTPIPRPQTTGNTSGFQSKQPSREQIAKRAYEIWKSGKGGSQDENWFRAERELRTM
jgi:hypothetical protein